MLIRDQILIATGIIAVLVMLEQEPPAPEARSTGRLSVEQQQHINLVDTIQTNEANQ